MVPIVTRYVSEETIFTRRNSAMRRCALGHVEDHNIHHALHGRRIGRMAMSIIALHIVAHFFKESNNLNTQKTRCSHFLGVEAASAMHPRRKDLWNARDPYVQ